MFDKAANTIVYDASDGVFSDIYDASTVVASHLQQSDTNQIADQQAVIQLRSIHYEGREDNIAIKFYNYSSTFVTIRWVDHKGQYSPSHTWVLAPNEELNQSTTASHIFVLSVSNSSDESVLGAFRPKRTLPSGTHHSVQVHDGDNDSSDYILEVILSHRYDALVVSSFWLNRNIVMKQTRQDATKTLKILHKIISNVIKDRSNETYRKLRLSNDTVKRYICNWATMEYLRVLGFQKKMLTNDQQEEEEYLIAEETPDDTTLALYVRGLSLIEILQSRCQPGFVADLAPRTPWETPIILNDNGSGNRRGRGGGGGRWGTAGSTNMMNPDDRWARVERARNFRRSAGPRPSPGNAPSDRGRWGRPR